MSRSFVSSGLVFVLLMDDETMTRLNPASPAAVNSWRSVRLIAEGEQGTSLMLIEAFV